MKLNKNLESLFTLFTKHAPTGAALLNFIKRNDEYIVLYRDDKNVCTPYIIHHLNDSGLYSGRYYAYYLVAWAEFQDAIE